MASFEIFIGVVITMCYICEAKIAVKTPILTSVLPRNYLEFKKFTANYTCDNIYADGKVTYLHYVFSSTRNETYLVCALRRLIFGYCLEYNEGNKTTQPNHKEDCTKYELSPCSDPYNSTDSYLIFQCFERRGGMSTPNQQMQNLMFCERQLANITREASPPQLPTDTDSSYRISELENANLNWRIAFGVVIGLLFTVVIPVCIVIYCSCSTKRSKNVEDKNDSRKYKKVEDNIPKGDGESNGRHSDGKSIDCLDDGESYGPQVEELDQNNIQESEQSSELKTYKRLDKKPPRIQYFMKKGFHGLKCAP